MNGDDGGKLFASVPIVLSRRERRALVAFFIAANGGTLAPVGRPPAGSSFVPVAVVARLSGSSPAAVRDDARRADVRAVAAALLAGVDLGAMLARLVLDRYGWAAAAAVPAGRAAVLPAADAAAVLPVDDGGASGDVLASDAAADALASALASLG